MIANSIMDIAETWCNKFLGGTVESYGEECTMKPKIKL